MALADIEEGNDMKSHIGATASVADGGSLEPTYAIPCVQKYYVMRWCALSRTTLCYTSEARPSALAAWG